MALPFFYALAAGHSSGTSRAVLVCNGKMVLEQAVHSEEVLPPRRWGDTPGLRMKTSFRAPATSMPLRVP